MDAAEQQHASMTEQLHLSYQINKFDLTSFVAKSLGKANVIHFHIIQHPTHTKLCKPSPEIKVQSRINNLSVLLQIINCFKMCLKYNHTENTHWLQRSGCETIRFMNSCNPALLCLMNSITAEA